MKPRDASTAHSSTAAESMHMLLKQNACYSKHINHDVLKDLFTDEKDRDLLYTLDEKDKDQNVIVVEEGGRYMGGHLLLREASRQRIYTEVFIVVACTSTRVNHEHLQTIIIEF